MLSTAISSSKLAVFPAFALHRTQRVLDAIGVAIARGNVPTTAKVGVGGFSSCYLTELYCQFQENPEEVYSSFFSEECFSTDAPLARRFWEYTRGASCSSRELPKSFDFKGTYDIIVTPSGTGGSSLSQVLINNYRNDPEVRFFKVGWCPPSSPLQQIVESGHQVIDVSAAFSGHADQQGLLEYIEAFPKLQTLVITHGEEASRQALRQAVYLVRPDLRVFTPAFGEPTDILTPCPAES